MSISAGPSLQVAIANGISSLRTCSVLDWREYVEAVSLVEQILQRDPAGVYRRMDFLSRDRQRRAVERLAPSSGEGQVRVALKAIENARQTTRRTGRRARRRTSATTCWARAARSWRRTSRTVRGQRNVSSASSSDTRRSSTSRRS